MKHPILAILFTLFVNAAAADEVKVYSLDTGGDVQDIEILDDDFLVHTAISRSFKLAIRNETFELHPAKPSAELDRSRPNDILPDGEIVEGAGKIRRAWLSAPTGRYGHAVLGDAVEAGAASAELADGAQISHVLDENAVFEDRYPRLADMDGDGDAELLVVKSYLDRGSALSVLAPRGGRLDIIAEAPAIGLSNRWLNPVGVADFDGDGINEAAVVITPHIGGTLQFYEMKGAALVEDVAAGGFSNHRMGSPNLALSVIADMNGDGIPDIVVPDAARQNLLAVTFGGGGYLELFRVSVKGPITSPIRARDIDADGRPEVVFGIGGGKLIVASPP